MSAAEDTAGFARLSQKKGQDFYFFLFEKTPDNTKVTKFLVDTTMISKDKAIRDAKVKDTTQHMASGKMTWSEEGNKLFVTPLKGGSSQMKDLVKKAAKDHAMTKPKEYVFHEEEEHKEEGNQPKVSGTTVESKAAEERNAAKTLREDVEKLLLSVDKDIQEHPAKGKETVESSRKKLVELGSAFKSTYPDGTQYPEDAVQKAQQHLDKLSEVLERTSEKGKSKGLANALESATDFKSWLDTSLRAAVDITPQKLRKKNESDEQGVEQLLAMRKEMSIRANNLKKFEDHAKYFTEKEWHLQKNIDVLELTIAKHLEPLQDAHGNVRKLAEKEDSMVKEAIGKVPEKAKAFQKGKFGARMTRISGMDDVTWESMIGTKSNAFDVISQTKVFDEDKLGKGTKPISYLTFQDSMYGDEPGSREKLVLSLYEKKLAKIKDDEAKKKLEKAVSDMKDSMKSPADFWKNASKEERKIATQKINDAFTAMGMKGVRPEVEKARNEIKTRFFLGKDHESINRGRSGRTLADTVLGFGPKAINALNAKEDKTNASKLGGLVEEVRKLQAALADVQRKLLGYTGTDAPEQLKKLETTAAEALKKKSDEAFVLMKGLDIGLKDGDGFGKGFETGAGIGSDDGSGKRDVYKPDNEVFMGKNLNVRDTESAASVIFEELGIPFTGGASGSTVDAVGGIVDALVKEGENGTEELKESDPRLASAEAETCMYIMGMHTAGHHSLVEMLYAAKQYPQKLFRNLRDPITDYIEYHDRVKDYLSKHPATEQLEKDEVAKNTLLSPEKRKELSAQRHDDMVKNCPENIISHDECTKKFMEHCEKVLAKVEA